MKRREFLFGAAAVGAVAGLKGVAFGQAGKAPAVAKEGEIKITDIKLYNTGRLYVRVMTDVRDIEGWGEVNYGVAEVAEAILKTYRPLLLNTNPTRVEYLWQLMYRAHRNMRGGGALLAAFAGIDMALWDIVGKVAKLPVHTLLGGPVRDKILFYPNAKAYKCTTHAIHDMIETPAEIDAAVSDLEKTRERLGKGGYLMFDGHGKFTAQVAIQLCKKIEHLGLLYFEEVVPPELNGDLVRVKKATSVPLAAGERMAGLWSFREVFRDQSADVLNADVVTIGGISQLVKLARIAEMYSVPIAPHGTHSLLGLAASLHVDAATQNFLIQECYPGKSEFLSAEWLKEWPKDEFMPVPTGPGLGVEVNVEALEAAVAKQEEKPERGIDKVYFRGDGAVGDR